MKEGLRLWTREELLLAINLYCKLPFGKLHKNNPEVIKLAKLIDRTTNSVAYKLVNFASLDPSLQARGIKGALHASKLDKEIWEEFYSNWDALSFQGEQLRATKENLPIEFLHEIPEQDLPKEGKMREQVVRVRVNQSFFRTAVLASYNYTCCITGLQYPQLIIAGHIRPWGIDEKNRMNPRNGVAMNALHDKAIERGLMTITPEYRIRISSTLMKEINNKPVQDYFTKYDNKEINLPSRFLPDKDFLAYHNQERFLI